MSAVSGWEIGVKKAKGRLTAPDDLAAVIEAKQLRHMPLTLEHAERAATLPPHHRDPFERILVTQARGLTLVTRDARLPLYHVSTIRARRSPVTAACGFSLRAPLPDGRESRRGLRDRRCPRPRQDAGSGEREAVRKPGQWWPRGVQPSAPAAGVTGWLRRAGRFADDAAAEATAVVLDVHEHPRARTSHKKPRPIENAHASGMVRTTICPDLIRAANAVIPQRTRDSIRYQRPGWRQGVARCCGARMSSNLCPERILSRWITLGLCSAVR